LALSPPTPSLQNARIKVALNRLRVADYPGAGMHRVLIDFYARNQLPGQPEDLHLPGAGGGAGADRGLSDLRRPQRRQ
jgi:hypothetical protein